MLAHLYLHSIFLFPQVDALLYSLDIDNDIQIKGPLPGRVRDLEEYWNESQGSIHAPAAAGWVAEYRQHKSESFSPNGWVNLFEQEHGPNGWASEFEHVRSAALNSAAFYCFNGWHVGLPYLASVFHISNGLPAFYLLSYLKSA